MANQATLSGLLQQNYGQALGAFQQQQGVNLAAGQANRAATQNAANQLAALGQQQYAQQAGAGQNLYNMGLGAGQALYGMGTGAGTAYANLGGAAEQAALNAGQAQMGAGQIQQQTDQAGRTAMYNQFLQQQGFPFQQAQFLANIAMGTGALSGQTTTTTQPGGWSDRRLKENIRKVGKTYDGQDIYSYRLKGEERTQLGLMAQDVEKHTPEAVGSSRGYKTLDYKKATDDAADRGHFADGGLVPSSMGGAVLEPGNFARGGYVTGGMVPSSPDEDGNPRYVWSDDVSSSGYGTPANEVKAAEDAKVAATNAQIANLYKTKLGRAGTPEEYAYWTGAMGKNNATIDQIGNAIGESVEGKAWATKAPNQMPTGIPTQPYQEALKYNADAFAPRAPVTRNASGFAAAAPGSSYSSFAPPQATGKGSSTTGYTPQSTGKGPASAPASAPAAIPQAVAQRYGSAVKPASSTTPTASGKGMSNPGYPSTGYTTPTASGKGPVASMASGGRIEKQGGGSIAAMLEQLAARRRQRMAKWAGLPEQSLIRASSTL
jgi:hypothetical protein